MNKEEVLVNELMDHNHHIAFAESCTGGLAAATIINVSNASKVINESIVTYANEAKMKYLDVKEETINNFGVVSEEVAKEMAIGICKQSGSDVGVGISGVAGPLGGTIYKPVGMVCFGFKVNDEVWSKTVHFGNIGRNVVRKKSVDFVLDELIAYYQGN